MIITDTFAQINIKQWKGGKKYLNKQMMMDDHSILLITLINGINDLRKYDRHVDHTFSDGSHGDIAHGNKRC